MTIRDDIKTKLLEIDENVYYGMIGDNIDIDEWNYIVFGKQKMKKADNGVDLVDYYVVTVVRENYIPDDVVTTVIAKMTEIPGMRLANSECEYEYTMKGNTNLVVEVLPIYFAKTLKRCKL